MLGLGNSMTSGSSSSWSPEDVANLTLWLNVNKNIEADQNNANASLSPVHSSNSGTMDDLDQISKWGANGSTTINAIQTTQADKPRWDTNAEYFGGLHFQLAEKYMDLDTQINCTGACSFVFRLKATDLNAVRAVMGSTNTEFLHFHSNAQLRIKVDNNQVNFTEASETFLVSKWYVIILVRNSSDEWTAYVRVDGAGGEERVWGDADQAQAGTFTVSNIGCKANDSDNFKGFMKDVLIYNGTALSSVEREEMYNYLLQTNAY